MLLGLNNKCTAFEKLIINCIKGPVYAGKCIKSHGTNKHETKLPICDKIFSRDKDPLIDPLKNADKCKYFSILVF